jgi:hypothetical protein
MRFLMSEELEFTVVGTVTSVNSTREASKAEEVRYLSGKERALNIPLSVKIASSWCFELYGSKMPYVRGRAKKVGSSICAYSISSICGLSSV